MLNQNKGDDRMLVIADCAKSCRQTVEKISASNAGLQRHTREIYKFIEQMARKIYELEQDLIEMRNKLAAACTETEGKL